MLQKTFCRIRRLFLNTRCLIFLILAITAALTALTFRPAIAGNDVAIQIVDAFQALFGVHEHFRPVHAKGIVCEGSFMPAPGAASLSQAAHLQGGDVPITVQFSDFSGIPTISDSGAFAGPRGMSIKFMLPDGSDTDIVAHSYNGFPVSTPEDFLAFLKALAAATHGGPSKGSELDQFAAAHPHAREFLDSPMPVPLSYGTESFYGVNAFLFTNAAGQSRYGRYIIRPLAGEAHLTPMDAAGRGRNFLAQELSGRLKAGPVEFRLLVQLAEAGDNVRDASVPWPPNRPIIELGTLSLGKLAADNSALQRELFFTPMNLPLGIGGSGDPLLAARTRAYGNSYHRRHD
ncbi:catalase family peroxidase [Rhodopila sp.]|uniref:catalase family peroxidase n=1 Tax=Rhodopila sp. TaxID=2480087 RepID=UPI003D0F9BE4